MTSKTGCPHRAQIFEIIGRVIDGAEDSSAEDAQWRLRELGRSLGLSSKDHELRRDLQSCFDWWSYQAFIGTMIDRQDAGSDWIRMPLVRRVLAAWKGGGRWDSSACPLRGAQLILSTSPDTFERILARAGRADVYHFLMRRAS